MNVTLRAAAGLAVACALASVVGCGGGGSPGGGGNVNPPPGTGRVRGQVIYHDNPNLPVTGVQVRVGNVVTSTRDSWFEVDVPAGTYQITVVPPERFVLPPHSVVEVTVAEGETVVLDKPFILFYETDLPPAPP
ncbi:MAG: hypothetical protein H5T86_10495 [Armatimonadetes bacterium]|nr:hypothetical protein [Armatimonadota bacterium]